MILILLLVFVITVVYFKVTKLCNHWTNRGIKQTGSSSVGFTIGSMVEMVLSTYKSFPEERFIGMYHMTFPSLVLRDPELVKLITVKNFDHFVNHRPFIPDSVDPLFRKTLFILKGNSWHDMRSTLSPSFSATKMKSMFLLISEYAASFAAHFAAMEQETVSLELKDAFNRYANDVIASSAFGAKCDSLKERENEFFVMGQKAMIIDGPWTNLKFFVMHVAPTICKVLGVRAFCSDVRKFFKKFVDETIAIREEKNIIRPDMFHLMMEARKRVLKNNAQDASKEPITNNDILAQVFTFLFAGSESVSTILSFVGHQLAIHPEIQQKLQDEIDATLKECKGELTYETMMQLPYTDMVISETLRMFPTVSLADRVCVKPYTIQPVKQADKPVHLKIGDVVLIPILAFHKDPVYFPNPEVFDPERFSDTNKGNIRPYTYFPFGLGPRKCIALRLALMQIKVLIFHLLSEFCLVPIERTQIPLKYKRGFNLVADNGFWVGLKKRSPEI